MRWVAYAAGGGLILLGLAGLLLDAGLTAPPSWALWFGGLAVAHDLVLVPLVLAAGLLVGRLRAPYRAACVVTGLVTLVALPMVLGFGRRADNPSQLPLDYGAGLAVVLVAVFAAAVAADLWLSRRRPGPRRDG
jgi:hypothetical protein